MKTSAPQHATLEAMRANARLVAAAPDVTQEAERLLAKLAYRLGAMGLRAEAGYTAAELEPLRAALRKARG